MEGTWPLLRFWRNTAGVIVGRHMMGERGVGASRFISFFMLKGSLMMSYVKLDIINLTGIVNSPRDLLSPD